MRLFFHGLHIPETLPGLESPLPGPDATAEVAVETRRDPARVRRGAARTQIERRQEED